MKKAVNYKGLPAWPSVWPSTHATSRPCVGPRPGAAAYIGIWIAFQVLYAVLYRAVGVQGGVAWFAHIGGFGAGLVLALACRHRREALAARA